MSGPIGRSALRLQPSALDRRLGQRRYMGRDCLTPFEAHILELLRSGLNRIEIATIASRSPQTISNSLTQAKDKPTYLYVLNDKANKHVPITAKTIEMEIKGDKPQTIEFKAESQEGDPKDESSRFTAPSGKVPDKLDLSKVEIHATIKDKQYHFVEDKD